MPRPLGFLIFLVPPCSLLLLLSPQMTKGCHTTWQSGVRVGQRQRQRQCAPPGAGAAGRTGGPRGVRGVLPTLHRGVVLHPARRGAALGSASSFLLPIPPCSCSLSEFAFLFTHSPYHPLRNFGLLSCTRGVDHMALLASSPRPSPERIRHRGISERAEDSLLSLNCPPLGAFVPSPLHTH